MPDNELNKSTKVIVTRSLPAAIEQRMLELFDVELNEEDTAFTREQLAEAMSRADVLVPTVTDRIDADLLAAAGDQLKLIANFGNGVDNIDVDAAYARGVSVTNTPSVLTEDTADMVMALILALPRRMVEGDRIMRVPGSFSGWSPNWMLGRRVSGKALGIIGMGRIGQAVAHRARAFGLSIHYHNRNPVHPDIEQEYQATYWDSLDRMLGHVDIVSINCPRTPATYHLLGKRRMTLLKPKAYVINTSRGEVLDEDALADGLKTGRVGGAALDVFEREPAVNPGCWNLIMSFYCRI